MNLKKLTYAMACLALTGLFSVKAAPVSKGRPARLAADWLREGNTRLGNTMSRQVRMKFHTGTSLEILFSTPYSLRLKEL